MITDKSHRGKPRRDMTCQGSNVWDILSRRKTEGGTATTSSATSSTTTSAGRATRWYNLAPQSRQRQRTFFNKRIEEHVKKAVKSGKNAVTLSGQGHLRNRRNGNLPGRPALRAVHREYEKKYVPSATRREATYVWKGGKDRRTTRPLHEEADANNAIDATATTT